MGTKLDKAIEAAAFGAALGAALGAVGLAGYLLIHLLAGLFHIIMSICAIYVAYILAIFICILIGATAIFSVSWVILQLLSALVTKISQLSAGIKKLTDQSQAAARDGAFIALISVAAALLAYLATTDYIEHMDVTSFISSTAIGYCVAKLAMMFPARSAKISGLILNIGIFLGTILFLCVHYNVMAMLCYLQRHPTWSEFFKLLSQTPDIAPPKYFILILSLVLSGIAVAYPFSREKWKEMLPWFKGSERR